MNDFELRLSTLEQQFKAHEQRQEDTVNHFNNLRDRFDEHLVENAKGQVELTRAVTRLTTVVESFEASQLDLKTAIKTAIENSNLAVKHDTIVRTVLWAGGIAASAVVGLWAVFTFFVK